MKTKRIFNKNFIITLSVIAVFAITNNSILTTGYSQEKNSNIIVGELGGNSVNLLADYFGHTVSQLKDMFNKPLQILIEVFKEVFRKLFEKGNPGKSSLVNEPETKAKVTQTEIIPATTYEEDCQEEEIGVEDSNPVPEDQISENNISKSSYRKTFNGSKPSNSSKTAYVFGDTTGSSPPSNDTNSSGNSFEYNNDIDNTPVQTNNEESSDISDEMDTLEDSPASENEEDIVPLEEEEPIPPYEPIEPFLVRSRRVPTGLGNGIELVILARNDSGRDTPLIGVNRVTINTLTSADGRNWRNDEISLNREDLLSEIGEEVYGSILPELFNVYSGTEIELGSIVVSGIEGFYCDYRLNIIVEDAYGRSYGSVNCGVTINRIEADE